MWDKVFYFGKRQCFCGVNVWEWALPLSIRFGFMGFGVTILCFYLDVYLAPNGEAIR